MDKQTLFAALKGKLIVSCQALEDEPLYDPERSLMGHMALAAKRGGASGIRANTVRDIEDIRRSPPPSWPGPMTAPPSPCSTSGRAGTWCSSAA